MASASRSGSMLMIIFTCLRPAALAVVAKPRCRHHLDMMLIGQRIDKHGISIAADVAQHYCRQPSSACFHLAINRRPFSFRNDGDHNLIRLAAPLSMASIIRRASLYYCRYVMTLISHRVNERRFGFLSIIVERQAAPPCSPS